MADLRLGGYVTRAIIWGFVALVVGGLLGWLINGCVPNRELRVVGADSLHVFVMPASTISNPGEGVVAVQYIFAPPDTSYRQITSWGMVSNDGETVWPRAGLFQMSNANIRWPTDAELGTAQWTNVSASGDTALLEFTLPTPMELLPQHAIVIFLEMPASGLASAVGVGPGFLFSNQLSSEGPRSFYRKADGTWWEFNEHDYAWAVRVERMELQPVPLPSVPVGSP